MSGGLLDLLSAAALDEDAIDRSLGHLNTPQDVLQGHDGAIYDAFEPARSLDDEQDLVETTVASEHSKGSLDSLAGYETDRIATSLLQSQRQCSSEPAAVVDAAYPPHEEPGVLETETDGVAALSPAATQEDVKEGAQLDESMYTISADVKENLAPTTLGVNVNAGSRNPKVTGVKRKASSSSFNSSASVHDAYTTDIADRGIASANAYDGTDRSRTRAATSLLVQTQLPPHRRERPTSPNVSLRGPSPHYNLPTSLSSILSAAPYSPELRQARNLPPLPPLPPAAYQTPTPLHHADYPYDMSSAVPINTEHPQAGAHIEQADSHSPMPAHSRRSGSAASPVQQAQTTAAARSAAPRKRARGSASQAARPSRSHVGTTPQSGTFPTSVSQRGRSLLAHSNFVAPERLPEDSGLIRCICPFDDDDGFTVQCDRCYGWLHGQCVGISADMEMPDDYICPMCDPTYRLSQADLLRAEQLQLVRRAEEVRIRQEMATAAAEANFEAARGLPSHLARLAQSGDAVPYTAGDPRFPEEDGSGLAYRHYPPGGAEWRHHASGTEIQQSGPSGQLGPGLQPGPPTSFPGVGHSVDNTLSAAQATSIGVSPALQPLTINRRRKQTSNTADSQNTQRTPSANTLASSARDLSQSATTPAAASAGPNKRKRVSQAGSNSRATTAGTSAGKKDSLPSSAAAQALAAVTGVHTGLLNDRYDKSAAFSIQSLPAGTAKDRLALRSRFANASAAGGVASPGVSMIEPVSARPVLPASGRNTVRDYAVDAEEGESSMFLDDGLSDDVLLDDDNDWRYDPWQYDYTPCTRLRYVDPKALKSIKAEMSNTIKRHRANLAETFILHSDKPETTNGYDNCRQEEAKEFDTAASSGARLPRSLAVRPSLLYLTSQRTASPDLSSGASTPAYSAVGVASALAGPVEPVMLGDLAEPPVDSAFTGKARLAVKTIAPGSFVLAPAMCTPFSGQTAVQSSGMNPFPRPPAYGVFTSTATAAGTCITYMYGEVVSGSAYKQDRANQWDILGVLKPFTRGVAQPWDLVLDQRRWGDETRFIRQGCHPNVHIKPVILLKDGDRIDSDAGNSEEAEADGYELAFGLFALQDIPRREELVLPFDWADGHVLHTLPVLLFSPDLIFPKMPRHTRTGDTSESDEVPSTSSFPLITLAQRSQIAACAKHIYWLSQLAASCCVTLLGNSVCACSKKRDCALVWLWKLAAVSEVPRKVLGGRPTPSDLDLVNVRAVFASALSLEEKASSKAGGKGGRGKDKKVFKRRRADLGALVGLVRGWGTQPSVQVSAIPPSPLAIPTTDHKVLAPLATTAVLSSDDIDRIFPLEISRKTSLNTGPTASENGFTRSPSPTMSLDMQRSASEKENAGPNRMPTSPRSTNKNIASPQRRIRKAKVTAPAARAIRNEGSSSESDLTEPLPSAGSSDEAASRPSVLQKRDISFHKTKKIPRKSSKKHTSPTSPVDLTQPASDSPRGATDGFGETKRPHIDHSVDAEVQQGNLSEIATMLSGPHLDDLFIADLILTPPAQADEQTSLESSSQTVLTSQLPIAFASNQDDQPRPSASIVENVQPPVAEPIAPIIEDKPAPPLRRLSFKAYQQRNNSSLSVPKSALQGSTVPEHIEASFSPNASHSSLRDDLMDSPVDTYLQQTPAIDHLDPQGQSSMAVDGKPLDADIDRTAGAPRARLSFAAYRQRLGTVPTSAAAVLPLPIPGTEVPTGTALLRPQVEYLAPITTTPIGVDQPVGRQQCPSVDSVVPLPEARPNRDHAATIGCDTESKASSVQDVMPVVDLAKAQDTDNTLDVTIAAQPQSERDNSSSPAKSVGEVLWPSPPTCITPFPSIVQISRPSVAAPEVVAQNLSSRLSMTDRNMELGSHAHTSSAVLTSSHDKPTDAGSDGRNIRGDLMHASQPRVPKHVNLSNSADNDLPYQRSSRSPPLVPRNTPTGPRNTSLGGRGRGWSSPHDRDRRFNRDGDRDREEPHPLQRMDRATSSEYSGRSRGDREPPSGPRGWQGRGDSRPFRGGGRGRSDRDRYDAVPSGPSAMGQRDHGWGFRGRGRGRGIYNRE